MKESFLMKNKVIKCIVIVVLVALLETVLQFAGTTGLSFLITPFIQDPTHMDDLQIYALLILIIVYSILIAVAFEWIFRKEYTGCLRSKGFLHSVRLALPFIIFETAWYIIKIRFGAAVYYPINFRAVLSGFQAGFIEEIVYRAIGTTLLLRFYRKENTIWIPIAASACIFGLTHMLNMTGMEDLLPTVITSLFAIGFGVIVEIIFILTGNIWGVILIHSLYDIASFLIEYNAFELSWALIGDLIGIFVIMFILVFRFRQKKSDAVQLWNSRWLNKTDD